MYLRKSTSFCIATSLVITIATVTLSTAVKAEDCNALYPTEELEKGRVEAKKVSDVGGAILSSYLQGTYGGSISEAYSEARVFYKDAQRIDKNMDALRSAGVKARRLCKKEAA